jgi:hypothetical protein
VVTEEIEEPPVYNSINDLRAQYRPGSDISKPVGTNPGYVPRFIQKAMN